MKTGSAVVLCDSPKTTRVVGSVSFFINLTASHSFFLRQTKLKSTDQIKASSKTLPMEENVNDEINEEGVMTKNVGGAKYCVKSHWRADEDAKLRELVNQHGPHNWNLIAQGLQGRSGKSCRLRWHNQLDPRITKKPFTLEEDMRLLAAQKAHGNRWALISRLFPGRTDNSLKNHFHVIMSKFHRGGSSYYRRRKMILMSQQQQQVAVGNTINPLPLFQHQGLCENSARNGRSEPLMLSLHSDANSEASAAESVVTQRNEGEKTSFPFIDFLGVGAT